MARSQCFRFSRNEYVSFCLSSIVSLSSATSTTTSNKFSGGRINVGVSVFLFVVVLTFANNNKDSKAKPFASPRIVPSFNTLPQYKACFKILRKSFELNTSSQAFSTTSKQERKSRASSLNCRANMSARRRCSKFGIVHIFRRNCSG